jgi:polar amino acid transport system substrate-binding protein
MKKLILTAAALLALGSATQAQETVRIATEGAYAPWNFLNDAGEPAGFEIDLGNAICAKAAITCEFIINDWDSIIPNLLAGNYDVIMAGMSITDERLDTIDFTQNYFPPDPSLFVAAAGAGIDPTALEGKRVGVQGGTIQAAYAEENLAAKNTVVSFGTADQAMADLAAGNLDTIIADGAYLEPVVAASSGARLRKDEAELKTKFDDALTALKADGTVDKLIAQWFEGRGPYFAE